MPEVIGQDDDKHKRATCRNCGAILKYWPREVKQRDGTDYGGGPSGEEWIDCPRCSKKVILRSW